MMKPEEVEETVAGHKFFEFRGLDEVFEEAAQTVRGDGDAERMESVLNLRYAAIIHDDAQLISAFERRFEACPSEFSP